MDTEIENLRMYFFSICKDVRDETLDRCEIWKPKDDRSLNLPTERMNLIFVFHYQTFNFTKNFDTAIYSSESFISR